MLDWDKYIAVADRFQYKAKPIDRQDLRQDIIAKLADVALANGAEGLSEGAMIRVASFTVMSYWRDELRKPTILSLSSETSDFEGHTTELLDTIADDHAIDLEAWCDARTWLLGCPTRLVAIAHKRVTGIVLNNADKLYLGKWRRKNQLRLVA